MIDNFTGKIEKDYTLKELTSWKIGGIAKYVLFPKDVKDIELSVNFAKEKGLPYFIMGKGSNILASDDYFDGVIINLTKGLKERALINFSKDRVNVYLGAGNLTSEILHYGIREEVSGLEFISGIPASLGGLIKMNAGAYGTEMMDVVESINLYSSKDGLYTLSKGELKYGYRNLELPEDVIILGATLNLYRGKERDIKDKITNFLAKRRDTQPLDMPSCGSVFKNPEGDYAGKIIEELGLKGYQVGGARISEKHANFIVNLGSATAKDVLTLIELIKQKAYLKKGIILKEEVVYLNMNNKVRARVI